MPALRLTKVTVMLDSDDIEDRELPRTCGNEKKITFIENIVA